MTTATSNSATLQTPTLPSGSGTSSYGATTNPLASPLDSQLSNRASLPTPPPPATSPDGPHSGIIWRHGITGETSMWQLQGTTFNQTVALPTVADTRWQLAASYDFDLDGYTDFLWRNATTGENSIWLMNGLTISRIVALDSLTGSNWQIAGVGDFFWPPSFLGTTRAELVWRNTATGEVSVWFRGDAGATYVAAVPDLNWQIEAIGRIGDFRLSSFVWRHQLTGEVSAWVMQDNDISIYPPYKTLSVSKIMHLGTVTDTHWKIRGARDFNYDLQDDLFWHNDATGENSIWSLDRNLQIGVVSLGSVTDLNWTPIVTALPNLPSPNIQFMNTNGHTSAPSVSGNTIVWSAWGNNLVSDVYLYDGTTTRALTNNDTFGAVNPKISGQWVTWVTSGIGQVYLYDGTQTITLPNSTNANSVQISGQNVVWEQNWGIYLYDGTSTRNLSNNNFRVVDLHISGNRVVWRSYVPRPDGSIDSQIFFYDGTQVQQLTNSTQPNYSPVVSNTFVAWSQLVDTSGLYDVYLYDGQTTRRITSTPITSRFVQVSDTDILWSTLEAPELDPGSRTQRPHTVYYLSDGQNTQRVNTQSQWIPGDDQDSPPVLVGSDVYWLGYDLVTPAEGLFRFRNGQTTRLGTNRTYFGPSSPNSGLSVSGSQAAWLTLNNLYTAVF